MYQSSSGKGYGSAVVQDVEIRASCGSEVLVWLASDSHIKSAISTACLHGRTMWRPEVQSVVGVMRQVSFVWHELREHIVVDCTGVTIDENNVYVVGFVSHGDPPEGFVKGSGAYKCQHSLGDFVLYLSHYEFFNDDFGGIHKFTIDHARTRELRRSQLGASFGV